MASYTRSKKIKDIESPSETLLFPTHPSVYSRGNAAAAADTDNNIKIESVSDIRLN